jgi:hypothetical protein
MVVPTLFGVTCTVDPVDMGKDPRSVGCHQGISDAPNVIGHQPYLLGYGGC